MAEEIKAEHSHSHHHHSSQGAAKHLLCSVVLYVLVSVFLHFFEVDATTTLLIYVALYIFVGYSILQNAIKGIFHGQWFDENFLITIATLGVFGLSLHQGNDEYEEAISVVLLFLIGEYFQGYASRKSIDKAKQMGLAVKTESKSEAFITRLSKVYTPFVCFGAILLAVIPPIFNIFLNNAAEWSTWIYRALTFLVISCPCAFVISIPMAFFAAIICGSRNGILITDGCCLEDVNKGTFPDGEILFADQSGDKMGLTKRIADKCMKIVWQNIAFIIFVKVGCLILGALGFTSMWLTIFADTGIMILAVLNSLRALKV